MFSIQATLSHKELLALRRTVKRIETGMHDLTADERLSIKTLVKNYWLARLDSIDSLPAALLSTAYRRRKERLVESATVFRRGKFGELGNAQYMEFGKLTGFMQEEFRRQLDHDLMDGGDKADFGDAISADIEVGLDLQAFINQYPKHFFKILLWKTGIDFGELDKKKADVISVELIRIVDAKIKNLLAQRQA